MPNEALESTINAVERSWFPANRAVIDQISEQVENGTYENNTEQLLEHVKQDYALFTYCLKELARLVNKK
ncbi:hypothetical protein OAO01_08115, partial [Oligoflexia bacterium]|nr:hypothetical protein [Oligoflexia bacterium]